MNDVTGMPQTAVVLGGTSDLARAVLAKLAPRRLNKVLLAGRNEQALANVASELADLGIEDVQSVRFDLREVEGHETFASQAIERLGTIDLLLVAGGSLGTADLTILGAENVAEIIDTNFAGPAAAIIAFAREMRKQGSGRIVVFSSAAGARVRKANFVYGGAKAGLDGFCQGLNDALAGTGVEVMIVRPGFVRTKMTAGKAPAPFATGADEVATAVVRGLEQGAAVVWVPSALAAIFVVLRLLPQRIWRLLPG